MSCTHLHNVWLASVIDSEVTYLNNNLPVACRTYLRFGLEQPIIGNSILQSLCFIYNLTYLTLLIYNLEEFSRLMQLLNHLRPSGSFVYHLLQKDRLCTFHTTPRRVRATIGAVEKQLSIKYNERISSMLC